MIEGNNENAVSCRGTVVSTDIGAISISDV